MFCAPVDLGFPLSSSLSQPLQNKLSHNRRAIIMDNEEKLILSTIGSDSKDERHSNRNSSVGRVHQDRQREEERVVVQQMISRQGEREECIILPPHWQPGDRDVLCGRARDNFHHEGNKFFRQVIQQNIGPYLASTTKTAKGEIIARIVDLVNEVGLFVKRDQAAGRWYKIKDSEARDKVGHAIRKASFSLEDTKPKLAARLKREHMSSPPSSASSKTTKKNSPMPASTGLKIEPSTKMPPPMPASSSSIPSSPRRKPVNQSTSRDIYVPGGESMNLANLSSSRTTVTAAVAARSLTSVATQDLPTESLIRALNSNRNQPDLSLLIKMELERKNRETISELAFGTLFTAAASALARPPTGLSNATASSSASAVLARAAATESDRPPYETSMVSPALATTSNQDDTAGRLREYLSSQLDLSASLPWGGTSSLLPRYDQIVQLQLQRERMNNELEMIRLLQQHQDAHFHRNIEYFSRPQSRLPTSFAGNTDVQSAAALLAAASSGTHNTSGSATFRGITDGTLSPALLQHLLSSDRTTIPSIEERLLATLARGRVGTDTSPNARMKHPPQN